MSRRTHLSLYGSVRRVPYFLAGAIPDPFEFVSQYGVALSTLNVTSNTITLTGLGEPVTVTLSGDGSAEYSKNGGGWATAPTTGDSGDTFAVRLDASGSYSTGVECTLDVGGVTSTFAVVTLADPSVTVQRGLHLTRLHARR